MHSASSGSEAYRATISRLRSIYDNRSGDPELTDLVDGRHEVIRRYQPIFKSIGLEALTEEIMLEFLRFENNQHWTGLHRMGPAITQNFRKLQKVLSEVLDEEVPIAKRLDRALDGRPEHAVHSVKGLGKAVLTGILLITNPEKYGVWNGTSEAAMTELGLWPDFERGTSVGARYERINELCRQVALDVGVDLWTLDALWWRAVAGQKPVDPPPLPEPSIPGEGAGNSRFGFEKHLEHFLVENWERTPLAKEWMLHEVGGDIQGYGCQFRTSVGPIDLLAKHREHDRWLVIELKRDQTSDQTLGQIQRYMGWVSENFENGKAHVEGLIVALDRDERLRLALKATSGIRFMRYEVKFNLAESEA